MIIIVERGRAFHFEKSYYSSLIIIIVVVIIKLKYTLLSESKGKIIRIVRVLDRLYEKKLG